MSVLLALGAALCWGSSDFAAGHASRSASAVSVTVLTHFTSAAVLGVLVWGGAPSGIDIGWGLAAGIGGGMGAMLLFRGLSNGSMAVVAPITAAGAATIPVVAGLASGETLSPTATGGLVLALAAIVLISLSAEDVPGDDSAVAANARAERGATAVLARPTTAPGLRRVLSRPGVGDALLSGVGFGLFFVFISRASDDAGYWPLFAARALSAALFIVVARRAVGPVIPPLGSRAPVVVAGVLDAAAAALFVAATRAGLLSIGAVLASLYPAATVLLARLVVDERIVRRQAVGLGVAGVAVSMLAL